MRRLATITAAALAGAAIAAGGFTLGALQAGHTAPPPAPSPAVAPPAPPPPPAPLAGLCPDGRAPDVRADWKRVCHPPTPERPSTVDAPLQAYWDAIDRDLERAHQECHRRHGPDANCTGSLSGEEVRVRDEQPEPQYEQPQWQEDLEDQNRKMRLDRLEADNRELEQRVKRQEECQRDEWRQAFC